MATDFIRQLRETDFSELDFNNLGVWPLAYRVLVLLAIFIVIVAGAYYFHIRDLNAEFDSVERKEAQLRKTFEEKAFEAANLEAYREQMKEIEASFEALLSQLPTDTEVPGMLEDITEIGHGSSLEIDVIQLQSERAAEYYVELPIQIVARGSYHDIGAFVSGISSLPRIVTLHDYSIRNLNEAGLLRFEVQAKTYRYKSEEE